MDYGQKEDDDDDKDSNNDYQRSDNNNYDINDGQEEDAEDKEASFIEKSKDDYYHIYDRDVAYTNDDDDTLHQPYDSMLRILNLNSYL